jgi:hypothetical protein
MTKRDWGMTKKSKFDDDEQYDIYEVGYGIDKGGVLERFRTLEVDIDIAPEAVYHFNGEPHIAEFTSVLDALEYVRQGDPDHLHLPNAIVRLGCIQKDLTRGYPLAAEHVKNAIVLLKDRERSRCWYVNEEKLFREHLADAIIIILGLPKSRQAR